jgi:hypothetical protein
MGNRWRGCGGAALVVAHLCIARSPILDLIALPGMPFFFENERYHENGIGIFFRNGEFRILPDEEKT